MKNRSLDGRMHFLFYSEEPAWPASRHGLLLSVGSSAMSHTPTAAAHRHTPFLQSAELVVLVADDCHAVWKVFICRRGGYDEWIFHVVTSLKCMRAFPVGNEVSRWCNNARNKVQPVFSQYMRGGTCNLWLLTTQELIRACISYSVHLLQAPARIQA